ncbi:MAG: IS4 family transposase [Planctomycetota bacterium]
MNKKHQDPDAPIPVKFVTEFLIDLLAPSMHRKRALSMAQASVGTMFARCLSVADVGRGLACAYGMMPKHGIKQVDRLLSNAKVRLYDIFSSSIPWLIGTRRRIVVSLDWTEYAKDGHSRIALNLITDHGRATPLAWKTVRSSQLKDKRNSYEDDLLQVLADHLPTGVKVTLLADRGFGDTKLYDVLEHDLGWDFVIRFRGNIRVRTQGGKATTASKLVAKNGAARGFKDAYVTRSEHRVGVVTVRRKGMKAAWCMATTLAADPNEVVDLYQRRFTCEETFRDEKDLRFGLGILATNIANPDRRDRLLAVLMLATIALTLLGAAGENLGCDRSLRSNTVKNKRTHSLFRQGREYMRGCARRVVAELRREFVNLINNHPRAHHTFATL